MKKLISELRELIDNSYGEGLKFSLYLDMVEKLEELEANIAKEPKPKKYQKFVELVDDGFITLIQRKNIVMIEWEVESFKLVTITTRDGSVGTYDVEGNQEVLENLIADFKG